MEDNDKRRMEAKLRASQLETKEFVREKIDQAITETRNDMGRLDLRMSGLERLIWNRMATFVAGCGVGLVTAIVLFALIK